MSSFKVVVTDWDFASLDRERAVLAGIGAELIPCQCRTEAELIAACRDADAILNEYARLTGPVLEQLTRCRAIVRYGVGVDSVDLKVAKALGIPVCNVPDYGVDEVASHALALLLASARRVAFYDREIRSGVWDFTRGRPIRRLPGQVLGLVGFGRIARALAAKALGIGLNVMAYDPLIPAEQFAKGGAGRADTLEALLSQADFVSLHVPATAETLHLMNAAAFRLMKPTAYLINTGRGALVDEGALLAALRSGQIAGAAIDVMEKEPATAGHPLLSEPNLVVTPHAAFYSEESLEDLQRKAAEEVVRALTGQPLRNPVNV